MFKQTIIKYYDSSSDDVAAISGASQVASSAIGAMAQSNLNKTTRNWDEAMYQQQRSDAISDWNRNNAYNAPAAQMARFQAAGLNPNLIYGQGNNGNAAPVRSSTVPQWSPKAPDYSGIASGIGNALSIKTQQQQLDNMKAQQALLTAQANNTNADTDNKQAQNPGITTSNASSAFDLQMKQNLAPITQALANTNLDQARAQLNKILTDTQFTLDKNDREAVMQDMNIKQAAQAILTSRQQQAQSQTEIERINQQIKNLQQSNSIDQLTQQMKAIDLENKKRGIESHDPVYWKILSRVVSGVDDDDNYIPRGTLPKLTPNGQPYTQQPQ